MKIHITLGELRNEVRTKKLTFFYQHAEINQMIEEADNARILSPIMQLHHGAS
jgi:hypothetical protein